MTRPTATPRRRWVSRMFQMRFSVFMVVVAGCALICWAYQFYRDNIDPDLSAFRLRIAELQNPDPAVRRYAAQSLDHIPPGRLAEGAAALMLAMRDGDPSVRGTAIASLSTSLVRYLKDTKGEIPPGYNAAALAVIATFRDQEPSVRAAAYQAMFLFLRRTRSPNGKFVSLGLDPRTMNTLMKTLDDGEPVIVREAFSVLFRSDLNLEPDTMVSMIRRLGPENRAEAVIYLGTYQHLRAKPPDEILAFLDDPDPVVRQISANMLGKRRWNEPIKIVQVLTKSLSKAGSGSEDQIAMILAISAYGTMPDEVVPTIIKILDEQSAESPSEKAWWSDKPHWFQRNTDDTPLALAITQASSEAARKALPALARSAMGKKVASSGAAEAIIRIAPDSPEARALVPLLAAEIREDIDKESKIWIANQLAALGPVAADAVPALIEIAKHPDTAVRAPASHALVQILGAKTAIPALSKIADDLLKEDIARFPGEVIDAILTLDPQSPEAAAMLLRVAEISKSTTHADRGNARIYLEGIANAAIADNPTLRKTAQSADSKLQARAKAVLDAINLPATDVDIKDTPHVR